MAWTVHGNMDIGSLGRVDGQDDLTSHACAHAGMEAPSMFASLQVLCAGVCGEETSRARIWRCGGQVGCLDGIVETRETSTLTSSRQPEQADQQWAQNCMHSKRYGGLRRKKKRAGVPERRTLNAAEQAHASGPCLALPLGLDCRGPLTALHPHPRRCHWPPGTAGRLT